MPAEHMTSPPSLAELLQGIADAPAISLSGIASDSRQLREGYLFLACKGLRGHGIDHLDKAIAAGACAVAWDSSTADAPEGTAGVAMIAVENLSRNLGEIAKRF